MPQRFFDVFGRCDLVFELFAKSSPQYKRIYEHTFVPNLVQIGQETAEKSWWKKKKKSKSTENHNITEILKNCIFAKTVIRSM
jgi:hypothetical protein